MIRRRPSVVLRQKSGLDQRRPWRRSFPRVAPDGAYGAPCPKAGREKRGPGRASAAMLPPPLPMPTEVVGSRIAHGVTPMIKWVCVWRTLPSPGRENPSPDPRDLADRLGPDERLRSRSRSTPKYHRWIRKNHGKWNSGKDADRFAPMNSAPTFPSYSRRKDIELSNSACRFRHRSGLSPKVRVSIKLWAAGPDHLYDRPKALWVWPGEMDFKRPMKLHRKSVFRESGLVRQYAGAPSAFREPSAAVGVEVFYVLRGY